MAAGPADMPHASFRETVGAAGIAATASLAKGAPAHAFGDKNPGREPRRGWLRALERTRRPLPTIGVLAGLVGAGTGVITLVTH